MSTVFDYFNKVKETASQVRKTGIPSEWELEKIEECINGLFSFSKFKVGDRVKMADTYPVNLKDSWGWMSIRHLVTKGQKATVKEVDWYKGTFVYLIEFDEKSWINDKGEVKSSNDSTCISIRQKWLTRIDNKK